MQNDLCLKVGDKVQIAENADYREIVAFPSGTLTTMILKGVDGKRYEFSRDRITSVKYNFSVGDSVQYGQGWGFLIETEDQAKKHNERQEAGEVVRRIATAEQFVLHNANIGTMTAPVTIPNDIFHVEKRLKPGRRVWDDLTVSVLPIEGHAAVKVSFVQPKTPVYNAATLREIAALLNEIADCL